MNFFAAFSLWQILDDSVQEHIKKLADIADLKEDDIRDQLKSGNKIKVSILRSLDFLLKSKHFIHFFLLKNTDNQSPPPQKPYP